MAQTNLKPKVVEEIGQDILPESLVNAAGFESITHNTHNAEVEPVELENIKGEKLLYVRIKTPKGKVAISIGEKNYKALMEILNK